MLPQEVLVPVDFGLGIDQDADEKQTIPGKLLTATNMRLEKRKRASKRYGYSRVGTGSNLLNGDVLLSLGKQLVAFKQNSTSTPDQVFGPGNSGYRSSAVANLGKRNVECAISIESVRAENKQQRNADNAVIGTVAFYVFADPNGASWYRVVDNLTNEVLVSETRIGNGTDAGLSPRVLALGSVFVVGVANTTTSRIEFRIFDPASSTILPTAAASFVAYVGNSIWDWEIYGSVCVAASLSAFAPTIVTLSRIDSTGAILTSNTFTAAAAVAVTQLVVCTPSTTASTVLRIIWFDATNGLQVRYFNPTTLAAHGTFGGANIVIAAPPGVSTAYADAAEGPTGANFVVALSSQVAALGTYNTIVRFVNDGNPAVTIVSTKTIRFAMLRSRMFVRNGRVYAVFAYFAQTGTAEPLQPSFFVYELDSVTAATGRIVARFLRGLAYCGDDKPHCKILQISTDVYQCSVSRVERGDQFTTSYSARTAKISIDFGMLGANPTAEIADVTIVGGGFLGQYDSGANIVEHGFFAFPEAITVTAAAAGALSAGTYQYAVCYEWIDARGKLHRSAPSVALSVVAAAGQRVNVVIATLHQTNKSGSAGLNEGRSDFQISVFRTIANGTTLYRVTDLPSTVANDTSVDTVTYADSTVSDAVLQTHEILYTTGGEYGNVTPDGPTALAAGNDRAFCNDVSDDGIVWFSKQIIPGEAVSFAAELYKRMSTDGGPVRAIAVMDKREIMFKRREIWVMAGNGPGPNGQGDSFTDPERLNVDGGCIRQTACVVTPVGVIVKNDAGFYLLGRDLSWRHIGVAVRDLEQYDVRRAVLVQDKHEVRFVLSNGTLLHYNYEFTDDQGNGTWYQSAFSALDAAVVDGTFYLIESSTKNVYREDSTRFTDEALGGGGSAASISITLETANIALGGINGFQRLWGIYLLGRYRSPHTLNVEIAYDQKDTYEPAAFTIDGATATAGGETYRILVQPRIQKCTAFRLRISDTPTGGSGESFDLTAMTLSVGVKKGGAKSRAAQRTG